MPRALAARFRHAWANEVVFYYTKEPGFFGKLFSRTGPTEQPLKYRINLKTEGQTTTVSVLNANGAPETSANAQRIVQVIADDLK